MLALLTAMLVVQQPDAAHQHDGVRLHGTAFLQYVREFGTRADYQVGSVNRIMVQVQRSSLQMRAMVSAEPLTVGGKGYPQLLQAAFVYRGTTITDRAHPDQWVMELAAVYELPPFFLYAAPVGDPALGPVTYQHRASAARDPTRPLGHHAQDGTHASFGVVTLGVFTRSVRVEMSAFNSRRPDDPSTVFGYRGARLDSYAGRVTVTPATGWSMSGSYGYLPATAGAHAHEARHRANVTAVYSRVPWSLAFIYGADFPLGSAPSQSTLLVEGDVAIGRHAVFGRAEYVQRTAEELALVGSVSPRIDIGAVSVGYAFRVGSVGGLTSAVGARGTVRIVPRQLEPFYGRRPFGIAAYLQLR